MVEKLADKLTALRENVTKNVPLATQNVMDSSARLLKESGILGGAKHVGDHAPDFVLKNVQGVPVDSKELRKGKKLVICFYRGGW